MKELLEFILSDGNNFVGTIIILGVIFLGTIKVIQEFKK